MCAGGNVGTPRCQLTNKAAKILIPGAGNAYETEYLHQNGFTNVHILDFVLDPLDAFYYKSRDRRRGIPYVPPSLFFEISGSPVRLVMTLHQCILSPLRDSVSMTPAS